MSTWRQNTEPSLIITEIPLLQALWSHFPDLDWSFVGHREKSDQAAPETVLLKALPIPSSIGIRAVSLQGFFLWGSEPLWFSLLDSPSLLPTPFSAEHWSPAHTWNPFSQSSSLQAYVLQGASQTKACRVMETLPGRQFIHSLWLPDVAPWSLTFSHG